ncbi:hypothetical protein HDV63DRAFT_387121 [Trichoderma sp. SZMC 28014]
MPRHGTLRKHLPDLADKWVPGGLYESEHRGVPVARLFAFSSGEDLPRPEISEVGVRHVDIIAVAGVSHNRETWIADDGAIWLEDRVPQLLAQQNIQARVCWYNYEADLAFTRTFDDIEKVAETLLKVIPREAWGDAPIIFVAHSLGGLVVKAALNKALAENSCYKKTAKRAAGCIFLGVPHRDADLRRWARHAASTMIELTGHRNNRLVWGMWRSSGEWEKVGEDDTFQMANISIGTVYETRRTGHQIHLVVDEHTATLGLPGERVIGLPNSDHCTICKFGHSEDESARFRALGDLVMEVVKSALERVANKETIQSLATQPEHCPTTSSPQMESALEHDPDFQNQVQENLF